MSKRPYVTTARLRSIRSELRPIHWRLLSDVARLNAASGNQLRRLHYEPSGTGRRMARLDLARLAELRVLARLGRRVGGRRSGSEGFVYALDVAGLRLVQPEGVRARQPWTPGTHHLRHALAVTELYVQLREIEAVGTIELEQFDTEPRCWRPYYGPGGSPVRLKPDAYAVTATAEYADSWFVELDRSTEPAPIIAEKARAYARYWQTGREQASEGVFPTVLFIVPDEKRKAQLVQVLGDMPSEMWQLFRVATTQKAAQSMSSGELINNAKEVTR